MKKYHVVFLLLAAFTSVGAGTSRETLVKVFSYSGTLSEPGVVSKKDARFSFQLEGETAREMFDSLGTNRVDPCTEQSGLVFRSSPNGALVCTHQVTTTAYSCTFGLDAKKARLIPGSIC